MAWITLDDVEPFVRIDLADDDTVDRLIAHAQLLAEVEIGDQDEPVSQKLSAVLTQIVVRMWRGSKEAELNPAGINQENLGPYGFQTQNSGAGLGLTNAEKKLLRKAAGLTGLSTIRLSRGPVEMADRHVDGLDPDDWL